MVQLVPQCTQGYPLPSAPFTAACTEVLKEAHCPLPPMVRQCSEGYPLTAPAVRQHTEVLEEAHCPLPHAVRLCSEGDLLHTAPYNASTLRAKH